MTHSFREGEALLDSSPEQRSLYLTQRLDCTYPDFGLQKGSSHASRANRKGENLTIETGSPSVRKRNSFPLTPVSECFKGGLKSTFQTFSSTNRAIRTKKATRNYKRTIPGEYAPGVNLERHFEWSLNPLASLPITSELIHLRLNTLCVLVHISFLY
jgi:hypothetical protein